MPTTSRTPAETDRMSNNRSSPSPSNLPFLVVEYDGNKAIIPRDTNFQETLAAIKELFSALEDVPDKAIRLHAHIQEIDESCRISGRLWTEVLPRLTAVQVVLDGSIRSAEPPPEPTEAEEQADAGATIHVHRRMWNSWTHPVFQIYTTRIPLDRTFGQLMEQITQQENITVTQCLFRYGNRDAAGAETLAQYGVTSGSVVHVLMQ